ncbi:unnamed protein product [Calypogeia fissa]
MGCNQIRLLQSLPVLCQRLSPSSRRTQGQACSLSVSEGESEQSPKHSRSSKLHLPWRTRHRWTGRYEAHLWDKSWWNQSQNKKGRQGRAVGFPGVYPNIEVLQDIITMAGGKLELAASLATNTSTSAPRVLKKKLQQLTTWQPSSTGV